MRSAACVGRVGGLAVTLGLGAAILSGWSCGLAWADDSPGAAGTAVASNAADADVATAKPSSSGKKAEPPGATTATTKSTTDGDAPAAKQDDVRAAPPGVVVSTGGPTEDRSTPTTDSPHSTGAEAPRKSDGDENPPRKPARTKGSDQSATKPTRTRSPAPVSVADADHDATQTATGNVATTDAGSRLTDLMADPIRQTGHASVRTALTESSTIGTPTPPEPRPPQAARVVSRLVSGIVDAVLSPFAASSTPEAPVGAPAMWSLTAFVRREFESALRFLTGTPAVRPTTGQTLSSRRGLEPEQRTLVLSAFPAEADAVLARTTLDPSPSVVIDGHHFYLGTLGGKKVIVAMTGIGMVNATQTTEIALDHFTSESGVSIGAVVFSGVAGGSGRTEIGDVAIPARWTSDDGETWRAVDTDMLVAASTLDVDLLSKDTIGDPACSCGLFAGPQIDLNREPDLFVGGDGSSDDNNNGTAFPAIPFGGDVFGPQPCAAPDRSLLFTGNFFQAIGPFLASGLISNITGLFTATNPPVDAVDQETAAAQQVADAHGVPFLGIRGMSDGPGDPLHLPGYPFTFFVYKQIAADNAAIVTEAFLRSWSGA
jgi:nucleoside phosphorylase